MVMVRGRAIPVFLNPHLEKRGLAGETFRNPSSIEISPAEKPIVRLSTLLHEMLHQVDFGLAEKTILRLEERLLELVIANPKVFRKVLRHAERS